MPICANVKNRPNKCLNKGMSLPIKRFKDKWGRVRKTCDDCRSKRAEYGRKYTLSLKEESEDKKYCSRAIGKMHCVNGRVLLPISKFRRGDKILKQCVDCRRARNAKQNKHRAEKPKANNSGSRFEHPMDEIMYKRWLLELAYGDSYVLAKERDNLVPGTEPEQDSR